MPVDPTVKVCDASLTGGAICSSVGLMARGLGASRLAEASNDNFDAGRRAVELFQLGVAAFARIVTNPVTIGNIYR